MGVAQIHLYSLDSQDNVLPETGRRYRIVASRGGAVVATGTTDARGIITFKVTSLLNAPADAVAMYELQLFDASSGEFKAPKYADRASSRFEFPVYKDRHISACLRNSVEKACVRIYYVDAGGKKVYCPDVKYRLMCARERRVVAEGMTGARGETKVAFPPGRKLASSIVELVENIFLDVDAFECWLEVWNAETKRYEKPEFVQASNLSKPLDMASNLDGVVRVEVKPYYLVRFAMKGASEKPIAKAPAIAYTTDLQGREVVAKCLDGRPVKGNTDVSGMTPRFHCAAQVHFKFDLPGTGISHRTRVLSPMVKGQTPWHYELGVKNVQSMTALPAGHAITAGGKTSAPLIVSMTEQEVLVLDKEIWDEFEKFSGQLESVLAAQHQAHAQLTQMLEGRSASEVARAEKELGIAEDKVKDMLNKNFSKLADLQEVMALESFGKKDADGNPTGKMGWRRRYIPKETYKRIKVRTLGSFPFKFTGGTNIGVKGAAGPGSIEGKGKITKLDAPALRDALSQVEKDMRAKLAKGWNADPVIIDFFGEGSHQMVEVLNRSDQWSTEQAEQWLRFVAGAGANAEGSWNPKDGKIKGQLSGNLQAKLVGYEGSYTHKYAWPSRKGWQMHFAGEDLGAICFELSCTFYGFIGAKASLMGSIGVTIESGKAVVKPQMRDRNDTYTKNFDEKKGFPRFEPAALEEEVPKDLNGASATAEIFAGAEGGIKPSGDIKWFSPEARNPVSLATLTLDVAANAGAGLSGQLNIYYAEGRFRIKVAARLCWGIGAKGALDFVVGVDGMLHFAHWVYMQLQHAYMRKLTYIATGAFESLSQWLAMMAMDCGSSQLGEKLFALSGDADQVARFLGEFVREMDSAKRLSQTVESLNSKQDWLPFLTPEGRGIILHALLSKTVANHLRDLPSVEGALKSNSIFGTTTLVGMVLNLDPEFHFLDEHKQAILNVLAPVQTRSEWTNVMQHMSKFGNVKGDAGKAEGDIVRFLNDGWSLNDDLDKVMVGMNQKPGVEQKKLGNRYLEEYLKKRAGLMGTFPKGYRVAEYGTPRFEMLASLDGATHPAFGRQRLDEAYADDLGMMA